MKRIRELYEPYMIRPIIYQCVTKCTTALAVILLWNRFINRQGTVVAFRDGGLFVGMVFLLLAWFSYLKLDGMKIHYLLEERRKKKPVRAGYTDLIDFADEHVVSYSELSDEEKAASRLASSLISGLIFLIPGVVLTVLMWA